MIHIVIANKQIVIAEDSRYLFNRLIESYNNTGKMLLLSIDEYSPQTTEKQHKLFKALVLRSSEVSGYTYKEFEQELIDQFAPYKYERSILGEMIKNRKSVSEMTNKEFNTFLEQAIEFCNSFYDVNF
jgi:hypothetical protein